MIRKLMIGAGLAALAAAAIAHDHAGPMADKEMTRAEVVAKVRDHFGKLDANKDGAIAKDEIAEMHEKRIEMRMGGDGPDEMKWEEKLPDANEAFDRLDANKDGSISREEFAKGRQIRIEKRIAMVDDIKDRKGNHMIRMHHMGGGDMGGHMIVMADTDKDGKVTLAEAEALALKHFDEMDANKDGKVTPEERKAARPMMKMKMHEIHTEHAPKAS